MKVNLIDARDPHLTRGQKIKMLRRNTCNAVVLLGHGSKDSFDVFGERELSKIPKAQFVWIYACECGLGLINRLASKYDKVLGYATTVLAPATSKSTVAHKIKKIIQEWDEDFDPDAVVNRVQSQLLSDASAFVRKAKVEKNGFYLVVAAVINHTRLSLRAGVV